MNGQSSAWRDTFRSHILLLEKFLLVRGTPLSGQNTVYLAGMVARELDTHYQSQIQDFLLEHPHEVDEVIRQHEPYIGQNAPIVTLTRINAEHLTFEIAIGSEDFSRYFQMMIPAKYFGIASFYSHQAGNRVLGEIFGFIRNHYRLVMDLLSGYLKYIKDADELELKISDEVWEKFSQERNERNEKKEWWGRRGIDLSKKNGISMQEVNAMIDFTSAN